MQVKVFQRRQSRSRTAVIASSVRTSANACKWSTIRWPPPKAAHTKSLRHSDEMIWYGGQGHSIIWRPFGHLPTRHRHWSGAAGWPVRDDRYANRVRPFERRLRKTPRRPKRRSTAYQRRFRARRVPSARNVGLLELVAPRPVLPISDIMSSQLRHAEVADEVVGTRGGSSPGPQCARFCDPSRAYRPPGAGAS
jgi:hypothetical protein